MNPVAFTVFGWPVRWYGICLTLGIIAGVIIATRLAKERDIDEDHIWTMILWAIPMSVIGSRVYYAVSYTHLFKARPGGNPLGRRASAPEGLLSGADDLATPGAGG